MAISYSFIFDTVKRFIEKGDFSDEKIELLVEDIKKLQINTINSIFLSGILRLYKDDYEKLKIDIVKLALLDDYSQYSEGDRVKAIGVLLSGFNIEFDDFTQLLNEAQARIEYEEIKDASLPF